MQVIFVFGVIIFVEHKGCVVAIEVFGCVNQLGVEGELVGSGNNGMQSGDSRGMPQKPSPYFIGQHPAHDLRHSLGGFFGRSIINLFAKDWRVVIDVGCGCGGKCRPRLLDVHTNPL